MVLVVTVPNDPRLLVDVFLPPTTHVVTSGGMAYRLYRMNGACPDRESVDPIDGAVLIRYRSFASEHAALAGIESEAA